MYLLLLILNRIIKLGRLRIINSNGKSYNVVGQPCEMLPKEICVEFHDGLFANYLAVSPTMALGTGYMNNRFSVKNATIYGFLEFLAINSENNDDHWLHKCLKSLALVSKRFQQFNIIKNSHKNVAHHYDLSGELYQLFLDPDRQYSCAYFEKNTNSLEKAQFDKKKHIAAKLLIESNHEVLDIGCGWGGMGLYIARQFGAKVKGITLSEEQLIEAKGRAKSEGLDKLVQFSLLDYRLINERYDRIVSVGMFEHVGVNHFKKFFEKISQSLKDDGIALIHTIGRLGPPSVTDPWIRKYIFPGGYIPSISEISPAIEISGLIITDVECLGLHYAETLKHWQTNFQAHRGKIIDIYDEAFCKMWEFYLAGSEISFRYMDSTVFQIQLVKNRYTVPMTRDYMNSSEVYVKNATKNKLKQPKNCS